MDKRFFFFKRKELWHSDKCMQKERVQASDTERPWFIIEGDFARFLSFATLVVVKVLSCIVLTAIQVAALVMGAFSQVLFDTLGWIFLVYLLRTGFVSESEKKKRALDQICVASARETQRRLRRRQEGPDKFRLLVRSCRGNSNNNKKIIKYKFALVVFKRPLAKQRAFFFLYKIGVKWVCTQSCVSVLS